MQGRRPPGPGLKNTGSEERLRSRICFFCFLPDLWSSHNPQSSDPSRGTDTKVQLDTNRKLSEIKQQSLRLNPNVPSQTSVAHCHHVKSAKHHKPLCWYTGLKTIRVKYILLWLQCIKQYVNLPVWSLLLSTANNMLFSHFLFATLQVWYFLWVPCWCSACQWLLMKHRHNSPECDTKKKEHFWPQP